MLGEVVLGGHAYPLHRGVDQLKISLGRAANKSFAFRRSGVALEARAVRAEFESMISEALDEVDHAIDRALQRAGLTDRQIGHVVRTGGSSQLRPFVQRVNRRFGAEKVQQRDAFVTVARGLAQQAWETQW